MSEKLTRLVVTIEAQNAQFIKELKRSQKETAYFKRQVQGSLNGIAASSGKSTAVVRSNFRAMRGSFGQFGYQIQDVAIQLQAGQNAMLIFGQQGSQIASIFGPGGAVVGAFLAVGAALGTAFLPKLFKTKETTEDLVKKVKDLNKEYDTLGNAQRAFLVRDQNEQIKEQNEIITKNKDKLEELRKEQEFIGSTTKDTTNVWANLATVTLATTSRMKDGLTDAGKTSEELAVQMETAAQTIAEAEKEIERINGTFVDQDAITKDRRKTLDEMISSLTEQAATYGYSATQLAIYKAGLEGATEAELDRIATLRGMIDAQDELKKAEEEAKKLKKGAQFREVDSVLSIGIGGYLDGSKDNMEDKVDGTNLRLDRLIDLSKNGRPIVT